MLTGAETATFAAWICWAEAAHATVAGPATLAGTATSSMKIVSDSSKVRLCLLVLLEVDFLHLTRLCDLIVCKDADQPVLVTHFAANTPWLCTCVQPSSELGLET